MSNTLIRGAESANWAESIQQYHATPILLMIAGQTMLSVYSESVDVPSASSFPRFLRQALVAKLEDPARFDEARIIAATVARLPGRE